MAKEKASVIDVLPIAEPDVQRRCSNGVVQKVLAGRPRTLRLELGVPPGFYTPTAAQPAMRVTDCCVGCAMMGGTTGYMHMYKVTARAVKAVSPDIKVLGPSFASTALHV